MGDSKEAEIFNQILEKTRSGSLQWEPTADTDEFVSSVKGQYSFGLVGPPTYAPALQMRDDEGRTLVTITIKTTGLEFQHEKFGELFELARRQALKVDESLENALDNLKTL